MRTTTACYDNIRMPQWLWNMEISMGAKVVYSLLWTASRRKDHAWPSQEYLACKCRVSVRSIQRYIQELTTHSLITVTRERIHGCLRNVYGFLEHEMIPKTQPKKFASRHDTSHDNLSCQEDIKNIDLKSPPSPHLPAVPPPEGESEKKLHTDYAVAEEVDQDPAWRAAKAEICESRPNLLPLLNQLIGQRQDDGSLSLSGPNTVITSIIERQHGQRITEVLSKAGIITHRFAIQSADLRRQLEAREQAVEIRRQNITAMRTRQAHLPHEQHPARFTPVTPAEQFDHLAKEYPSKKCSWAARQTFLRMSTRNELPPYQVLLSAIRRHKADPAWQRDCGRWVPHMSNWFIQHRWEDA
jgi:hypothetical protein